MDLGSHGTVPEFVPLSLIPISSPVSALGALPGDLPLDYSGEPDPAAGDQG